MMFTFDPRLIPRVRFMMFTFDLHLIPRVRLVMFTFDPHLIPRVRLVKVQLEVNWTSIVSHPNLSLRRTILQPLTIILHPHNIDFRVQGMPKISKTDSSVRLCVPKLSDFKSLVILRQKWSRSREHGQSSLHTTREVPLPTRKPVFVKYSFHRSAPVVAGV